MRNLSLILAGLLLLGGCAKPKQDDPLKNTKKLVVKGHVGLYENGAFQVPHTSFKLIPAGPEPMELARELVGIRATESFDKAIREAKESVYIIPEGSKYSLELAEAIYGSISETGEGVTDSTRRAGTWIIDKSSKEAVDRILGAPGSGMAAGAATYEYGDELESGIYVSAESFLAEGQASSASTMKATLKTSGKISKSTERGAAKKMDWAAETFIVGYVTLPDKLSTRGANIAEAADGEKFVTAFDEAWEIREEHSVYFADLFGSAVSNYGDNVGASMEKAKSAFLDNYADEGVIFASLKSMRWALQGLIYNGIIEPVGKMTAGAVGYVSVNGIVFPVTLALKEGIAVTEVAVEVTYNGAMGVYEITAPTVGAALAGVLGSVEYVGGKAAAGVTLAGGTAVSGVQQAGGYVAAGATATGGFVAGKSVKYIGVPLAAAGVTLGEASYGVVAGTAGAVAGGTVLATGEVAGVGAKGVGAVAGGTVLVGGAALSTAAGAGIGAYQLSKAVVVPAGYTLTSGVVLGYGTTSQLAAHSVLAVSDASYLVLSLEGPKWVVYAVSGDLGGSDELPSGTVVDLEAMKQKGETIRYLPVSEGEIEKVVEALPEDLPGGSGTMAEKK